MMATKRCPFCGNPAQSKTVGDAYNLDCGFCEIRIEITKDAYTTPCADADAVLGNIRQRMAWGAGRPRIERSAMLRPTPEAPG
jgi:hypothetical protein